VPLQKKKIECTAAQAQPRPGVTCGPGVFPFMGQRDARHALVGLLYLVTFAGLPGAWSIGADLQSLLAMGVQVVTDGAPTNSSSCGVALGLAQGSLTVLCDSPDAAGAVQELRVVGPASLTLGSGASIGQLRGLQVGCRLPQGFCCCCCCKVFLLDLVGPNVNLKGTPCCSLGPLSATAYDGVPPFD
jgi:hypothetical protein